jgi:hypothetical protein
MLINKTCRGRFIAPTADLSAIHGIHNTPLHVLIHIIAHTADYADEQNNRETRRGRFIGLRWFSQYPSYFIHFHYRPSSSVNLLSAFHRQCALIAIIKKLYPSTSILQQTRINIPSWSCRSQAATFTQTQYAHWLGVLECGKIS